LFGRPCGFAVINRRIRRMMKRRAG
jgi:hypothetical protein